jgi:hypothetical protein
MPQDKAHLTNALKLAKTKPMFFAFVAKGNEGRLLLDPKKVSPKDLAEAKKECGGGAIFKGRTVHEEGELIFEVAKEPPGTLAALIKKVIKTDAAMTLNVTIRVNAELESEEGEHESEEKPPEAPPADADGAAIIKRLNGLAAGIKAAMAGPQKARVQALFASAGALIKSKEFARATEAIDELESLIGQPPPAPPAPPPQQANDRAAITHRLNALSPSIKSAFAGPNGASVQATFANVNTFIKAQQWPLASKALDDLEALATAIPAPLSLVKLGKARLEWNDVRNHAIREFQRLKSLLQEEYRDDAAEAATLAKAVQRLDGAIASLNEQLGADLDAVLNADAAKRPQAITTAKATLRRFVALIETDELMSLMDGNEFAPEMEVAAPMRDKLEEITTSLG